MKVFFLRLGMVGMIQEWPLSSLLFKNILGNPGYWSRAKSINQSINYIEKEGIKMSLFTDDMVICIYNSKEPASS